MCFLTGGLLELDCSFQFSYTSMSVYMLLGCAAAGKPYIHMHDTPAAGFHTVYMSPV